MTKLSQELQVQMRRDLFAAYADVTSKPCPSQAVAWIRTVRHPAPRYYISSKIAQNVLGPLLTGNRSALDKMLPHKRRMYLALEQEVLRLSQKRDFQGKSAKFIISFAIQQPAPEFYISHEHFKKIFRNAKRYGIDFNWKTVIPLNKKYTNRRDGKPKTAVYRGKKRLIISQCSDTSLQQ